MKNKLFWIFVGAFIFRITLSFIVWHPDLNNHVDWGIRFFEYGPSKFFAPESNVWSFTWPNQPPGTIYMFAGIRKLFELIFSAFWWINVKIPAFPSVIITYFESNLYPALLKLPGILSDFGIAILIFKLIRTIKSERLATLGAIIFLFNPVVWYNSAVWGQTDPIINFFALLSFFYLLKRKLIPAVFFLAISFYIKISLAIFIPIFAIVAIRQKYIITDWIKSIGVTLLIIGIATLPFSKGEPFSWLLGLYQHNILGQQLQVITANAFNLWAAIAGIHERPQTLMFGPMTYQVWGIILFTIAYVPTLFSLYKKQDLKTVVWALTMASFSSFMLLTNMHERYLYPLFPVFTILAILETKLMSIYWLISGINLLNLYNFWFTPKVKLIVDFLSFGNRIVPRVLGLGNFGLFMLVYKKFSKSFK